MARQKHSGVGGFTTGVFVALGVPEDLAPALEAAGNYSLAANSWRTYDTVDRHIVACEIDIGRELVFPLSLGDILTWVGWLVQRRGVRAKTIQVYLSGLRICHIKRGFFGVNLYSDIVKHIVTGLKQRDLVADKLKKREGRLPVTLDVLNTLRIKIRRSGWPIQKKRLVWCVCAMGFAGSFRVHEMLSRKGMEFDPTSTLLAEDVAVEVMRSEGGLRVLKVKLKAPKEARLRHGVAVDLFPTDSYLCPVTAMEKYILAVPFTLAKNKPIFRREDGQAYTGAAFNADLKKLLAGTVHGGRVTSHSLRAGLATEMGRVGYSEADIMCIGRWHSSAYLQYVKGGRLQRMKVARELAGSIMAGRRVVA